MLKCKAITVSECCNVVVETIQYDLHMAVSLESHLHECNPPRPSEVARPWFVAVSATVEQDQRMLPALAPMRLHSAQCKRNRVSERWSSCVHFLHWMKCCLRKYGAMTKVMKRRQPTIDSRDDANQAYDRFQMASRSVIDLDGVARGESLAHENRAHSM